MGPVAAGPIAPAGPVGKSGGLVDGDLGLNKQESKTPAVAVRTLFPETWVWSNEVSK